MATSTHKQKSGDDESFLLLTLNEDAADDDEVDTPKPASVRCEKKVIRVG